MLNNNVKYLHVKSFFLNAFLNVSLKNSYLKITECDFKCIFKFCHLNVFTSGPLTFVFLKMTLYIDCMYNGFLLNVFLNGSLNYT